MPTVHAGDLPYQAFNSEVPSPVVPSTYQSIRTSAADFGADVGVGLEKLGRSIGQAADVAAEGAIARQEFENKVKADDYTNKYQESVTKLLYGNPDDPTDTGFLGKRGEDAARAYPGVYKSIIDLRNQMRGQLANDKQRLLFDGETRRTQIITLSHMGGHYEREFKNYATAVNKATAENGMAQAATGLERGDQAAFEDGIGKRMKAELEQARLAGTANNPEVMNKILGDAREDAVKMKFQKLAETNPYKAKQFLDVNSDALKPGEAHALRQSIDAQWRKVQAQIDAGEMPAPEGWNEPAKIPSGDNSDVNTRGNGAGHVVSKAERISYYRQRAAELGLNAEAVIATVNGEGLHNYTGDNGTSFGDFQLHVGGGMGDNAETAGIRIRDPNTWKQQADFALEQMASRKGDAGWYAGQWHGAPAWAAQSFGAAGGAKWRTKEEIAKGVPPGQGTAVPEVASKTQPSGSSTPEELDLLEGGGGGDAPDSIENAPKPKKGVAPIPPPEPGEAIDTAIPGLSEKLENIASQPWAKDNPIRLYDAIRAARAAANARWTESQRALRLNNEQIKAISEATQDQYMQSLSKGAQIDIRQIEGDARMTPEHRREMVRFVERENKQDPAALVSKRNTVTLLDNIWNGKITEETPLKEAYLRGDVTYQDFEKARKEFRDQRSEGGETLKEQKRELMGAVTNRILGPYAVDRESEALDEVAASKEGRPSAKMRVYNYITDMNQKIDQYQKEGKNPRDLFNPKNQDFLGSPENLKRFEPTLRQKVDAGKTAPAKAPEEMTNQELVDFAKRATNDADYARAIAEGVKRGMIAQPAPPPIPGPQAPVAR